MKNLIAIALLFASTASIGVAAEPESTTTTETSSSVAAQYEAAAEHYRQIIEGSLDPERQERAERDRQALQELIKRLLDEYPLPKPPAVPTDAEPLLPDKVEPQKLEDPVIAQPLTEPDSTANPSEQAAQTTESEHVVPLTTTSDAPSIHRPPAIAEKPRAVEPVASESQPVINTAWERFPPPPPMATPSPEVIRVFRARNLAPLENPRLKPALRGLADDLDRLQKEVEGLIEI